MEILFHSLQLSECMATGPFKHCLEESLPKIFFVIFAESFLWRTWPSLLRIDFDLKTGPYLGMGKGSWLYYWQNSPHSPSIRLLISSHGITLADCPPILSLGAQCFINSNPKFLWVRLPSLAITLTLLLITKSLSKLHLSGSGQLNATK